MKKILIPGLIIFLIITTAVVLSSRQTGEQEKGLQYTLDKYGRTIEDRHPDGSRFPYKPEAPPEGFGHEQDYAYPTALDNSGWFLPYKTYAAGAFTIGVAIGDLNSDGRNDIAVIASSSYDTPGDYRLFVFIQGADGQLTAPVTYDANTVGTNKLIDIGDMNGDGRDDVVILTPSGVGIYYQNGGGTLEPVTTNATTYYALTELALKVGDLNDDGRADVAVCSVDASIYYIEVLTQDVGGNLVAGATYVIPSSSRDIEIEDVTGDGLSDAVCMMEYNSNQEVGVLAQNGGNTLDAVVTYDMGNPTWTNEIAAGDVTGDGRGDVIVTNGGNSTTSFIGVFAQIGGGTLDNMIKYSAHNNSNQVLVGDGNRDGRGDVLVAHSSWNSFGLFKQKTDGTLDTEERYVVPDPSGRGSFVYGDINGDGLKDIVLASANDGLEVCLGSNQSDAMVLRQPNGGQDLVMGGWYSITWGTVGDYGGVDIYYSLNGGSSWTQIVDDTFDDGSYNWDIPYTPSTDCKIRVTTTGGGYSDSSDYSFVIVDDSVDRVIVTSPDGGEILEENSTHNITWYSTGDVTDVRIEYSVDNGSNYNDIIASTSSSGSYSWTVPGDVSDQCLVRISDVADSDPSDTSESVFEIVAEGTNTINVLYPNGGETLYNGSTAVITWATTGTVGNVKIEYSVDKGGHWGDVIASTDNDGAYTWTVPGQESTSCLIRITSVDDATLTDQSAAVFTMTKQVNPNPNPNPTPVDRKPVAQIYIPSYNFYTGDKVNLSAEPSYDRNGTIVAYEWKMLSKPSGSSARIANTGAKKTSFRADKGGTYRMSLRVKDDDNKWSDTLTFQITASKGLPPNINLIVERKDVGAVMIQTSYAKIKVGIMPSFEVPAIISRYALYRSTDGGGWEHLVDFQDQLTADKWGTVFFYEHVDQYLDKNKSYTYKVTAVNSDGEEVISMEKSL